jgi:protein-S-isoprenylcysteine O-methyltransferase Ste14
MSEAEIHAWATWLEIFLAGVTCLALLFITAPYGRHWRSGWGPTIPNRVSWILMELPAVVLFLWIFTLGEHRTEAVPLVFLGLWQLHYIHRVFIFPFRLRTDGKRIALLIGGLAIVFNILNAYVNARWISHFGVYQNSWLLDPRFIAGVLVFMLGFGINLKADQILLNLRKPGETGYKVPRGWLYEYVTCPNYLGEIIEWLGFALATWSLAGLAFALYTAANLGPRALANHRWYLEQFPDYPKNRKALIPFLL